MNNLIWIWIGVDWIFSFFIFKISKEHCGNFIAPGDLNKTISLTANTHKCSWNVTNIANLSRIVTTNFHIAITNRKNILPNLYHCFIEGFFFVSVFKNVFKHLLFILNIFSNTRKPFWITRNFF